MSMESTEVQPATSATPITNLKKKNLITIFYSQFNTYTSVFLSLVNFSTHAPINLIHTYLSMYENVRNNIVLSMYVKYPKAVPAIACVNAPALYINFTPIFVPNLPNSGAEMNAAKLVIPKTNPY